MKQEYKIPVNPDFAGPLLSKQLKYIVSYKGAYFIKVILGSYFLHSEELHIYYRINYNFIAVCSMEEL